ncbi:MAG TPA: thioredoxin domain-containing protein [Aggregatilineaceae bacterium]|nr:thioredoxin domain-containing protein [Aggregatilineaceae bacterium]
MATKTAKSGEPRRQTPWRSRATFPIGKTRLQRKQQYRQQVNVLLGVVIATVVVAGLVINANWRGSGSTRSLSCTSYPQYCVPFVGGAAGSDPAIATSEASSARTLDESSQGATGVVRGFTANGFPFIGDPNAPIHILVVADYSCSHCNDYHTSDLERILHDFVLTGKATLESVLTTGTGGQYSDTATQAALCAGEQGAFWEMSDELYRLSRSMGVQTAYSLTQIRQSAQDMGLDGDTLVTCVASNRYANFMTNFQTFANDHGVTGTPTVLVSYGDSNQWTAVDRDYNTLKQWIDAANAQQ